MSDDEKRLDEELRRLGHAVQKLAEVGEQLIETGRILDELNSAFPETQKFLKARGLTRVSQLDAPGRKELEEYLIQRLHELRPPS